MPCGHEWSLRTLGGRCCPLVSEGHGLVSLNGCHPLLNGGLHLAHQTVIPLADLPSQKLGSGFDPTHSVTKLPIDGLNVRVFRDVGEDNGIVNDFTLDRVAEACCGVAEQILIARERNPDLERCCIDKVWAGASEESVLTVLRNLQLGFNRLEFSNIVSVEGRDVQRVSLDDLVYQCLWWSFQQNLLRYRGQLLLEPIRQHQRDFIW